MFENSRTSLYKKQKVKHNMINPIFHDEKNINDQNMLYDLVFVCGIYKSGTSLSPLDFTDRSLYTIINFLSQLNLPTVLKDPQFT